MKYLVDMLKKGISLLSILFLFSSAFSQQVKVTGSSGIYHDYYSYSYNGDDAFTPRRPQNFTRLVANPFIYGENFDIPIQLSLSFQRTNTLYPNTPDQNFLDNPTNQIYIAPRYKDLRLHLGRFFPQHGEFTTGNQSILGFGFTYKPGKWVVELASGYSQNEVLPDSSAFILGAYKRNHLFVKVGRGTHSGSYIHLNVAYTKDQVNDFIYQNSNLRPEEGITFSPAFGIRLSPKLQWQNEIALGVYTPNTELSFDGDDGPIELPRAAPITINASTRYDYAGSSTVKLDGEKIDLQAKALYVGPNFRTYGFPFFQNDRLEFTLSPSYQSSSGKLIANLTGGYRINDLADTKAQKLTQQLISANINSLLSQVVTLNFSYSNFGIENDQSSDSLKVRNIANSLSFSPNLYFSRGKLAHNISANASVSQFQEFNAVSTQQSDQYSQNLSVQYSISWFEIPLSLWAAYGVFENTSNFFKLNTSSSSLGASYKFFKKKLSVSANIDLLNSEQESFSSDRKIGQRFRLSYKASKKLNLQLSLANSRFDYGSIKPNTELREWYIQSALLYNF